MSALERELATVSGVSEARVDESEGAVAKLHVVLDEDADRDSVAAAVDVVLRRHGLKSRQSIPDSSEEVEEVGSTTVADPSEVATEVPSSAAVSGGEVAEVRVAHRSGSVEVTVVATDGRVAKRDAVARDDARASAIVGAVSELLGSSVPPHVVEVVGEQRSGHRAVTVVLDVGGDMAIGVAFDRGSSDLGLARAAWRALGGS